MKVDIVIDFYDKHPIWPLVAWGLEQNAEHINRLYLVKDDRWLQPELDALELCLDKVVMIPLDHERKGITPQRSIRQGAEEVNTEYFCHMDSDIILAPGSLAENLELIEPDLIVYGNVPDVSKDTRLADLPNPIVARPDWRRKVALDDVARYLLCRDSYWIMRTEDYLANDGGHDITYPGYGCVDYDFACRWMMKHGLDSWTLGPGIGYHVGGDERQHETDPVNHRKFREVEAQYVKALEAGSVCS